MVSEFEFLHDLRTKYSLDKVGDDCAILPKDAKHDLLLTADLLIEDIDFEMDWTTPEVLGHKALAVSLSDIAAMGGKPAWAMVSLGVPETVWDSSFVDRFYDGWFALANEFGVELVGGDISRSPDKLIIDSIAGGEVAHGRAIRRSGAKPGDSIFVTGTLGGASGGLKLLKRGFRILDGLDDLSNNLVLQQLKPTPQLSSANLLQPLDIVTSMIDLSDGLSSDLGHICSESGVGARIYADRLPIDENLENYFTSDDCFEMAVNGGEDFGLLLTVNEKNISSLESIAVTQIGEITATTGNIELIRDGESAILEPKGYQHF